MATPAVQRFTWSVALVVTLSLCYAVLQVGFVRPRLPADQTPVLVTARPPADAAERLESWRQEYREGKALERPPVWRTDAPDVWARQHLGKTIQVLVFTLAAVTLLVLRSYDFTAGLAVLALALSAVAGGGPLLGLEYSLPFGLGPLLTVFTWIAGPLAFPIIALAILYFPSRSPLLARYPILHAVPFVAAAPMLAAGAGTGLYLSGVDAVRFLALWDARNPAAYFASFAAALALNLAVIVEGVYRYGYNHDANERRRIRMAVYTAVPGVAAFAIRDGVPILAQLAGSAPPVFADGFAAILQAIILLPAFGLVYAIGVERVLGPRTVLRQSLQYALASRTLTAVAMLPVFAFAALLGLNRDRTVAEIARGSWFTLLALVAASFAAFHYRYRARQWLDQRFFREEYDARKILLSLAGRVRTESNPADLSSLVLQQIDAALHPRAGAILVAGIEEGQLTPVTVLHGSAESLPLDGGIAAMLRWSDEPLELFFNDPRSPARRLPPDEQEWLECTGARLLLPVVGQDGALVAMIAIGEKRSEAAYTAEDRQLLASIAAQMGLGFDVARLRRRVDSGEEATRETDAASSAPPSAMVECPRCGRCEEMGTTICPVDGAPMSPVPSVPLVVDDKYRIEQLLGRGGMGAVYRARDLRLDRLVALKVVRADLLGDADARRRFRREAQIVARLQHPAIVSIFDFGTIAGGGAYLVMELVRGEDLRRVLQREGRLDPPRALRILTTVCAGIEAAHREGVLHRDLKPENILLPGGDVEAKVLDFGVAKVLEDTQSPAAEPATLMTEAGVIVGTPAYMAPEQLRAGVVDARTDVFSLGVIAYEMLSGELPFGRNSVADVVLAHTRAVPRIPNVPDALERAVCAALEREPDRRPASPQAFAHLIAAAASL